MLRICLSVCLCDNLFQLSVISALIIIADRVCLSVILTVCLTVCQSIGSVRWSVSQSGRICLLVCRSIDSLSVCLSDGRSVCLLIGSVCRSVTRFDLLACRPTYRAFSIYKKIRKFSIENFRLGKARSICHKPHSREAWPLNRPRKAWNW